jgi:hypothetical protein
VWRRQAHDRTGLGHRCAARFPWQQRYSESCIHNSLYCGVPAEGIRRTGSGELGRTGRGHTTARPTAHVRGAQLSACVHFCAGSKMFGAQHFYADARCALALHPRGGAARPTPCRSARPVKTRQPSGQGHQFIREESERRSSAYEPELNTTVKQCTVESIGGPPFWSMGLMMPIASTVVVIINRRNTKVLPLSALASAS